MRRIVSLALFVCCALLSGCVATNENCKAPEETYNGNPEVVESPKSVVGKSETSNVRRSTPSVFCGDRNVSDDF